ncbi:hypothetical protein DFJ77DRAFT_466752 [Powellomyces hirtus]|nr:hypothetical protein DFJ77DRAFT_466752 [Powellomyces hirtus]
MPPQPLPRLPSVLSSARSAAPQNTVPIDPSLIDDVERHAQELSNGVYALVANLKTRMDEITSCTTTTVSVTRDAAVNLSTSATESMRQMDILIDAVMELRGDMGVIQTLATQIKSVKESLDGLEAIIGKG